MVHVCSWFTQTTYQTQRLPWQAASRQIDPFSSIQVSSQHFIRPTWGNYFTLRRAWEENKPFLSLSSLAPKYRTKRLCRKICIHSSVGSNKRRWSLTLTSATPYKSSKMKEHIINIQLLCPWSSPVRGTLSDTAKQRQMGFLHQQRLH